MSDRKNTFEMPKLVVKDESTATPTFASYSAETFENGYAQTVGNSLRRVLLSSIEGVAITAVKIKGADHEFMAVPGISEDVTDIIIAIKQVLIKAPGALPERITIRKKGPCVVTAGDFVSENAIEIVNPELHIATVADGGEFELEAELATGHGFHPAKWNKKPEQEIGIIPVDSIFSPVTRVNFTVKPKRLGNRNDYESLVLDVWTDGRITPDEALRTGSQLLRDHFDPFAAFSSAVGENAPEASAAAPVADDKLAQHLAMSVNEIELSVRSANCLNNAKITTVGELICHSEQEMLKFRNFGKKSLDEIKAKLAEYGLGFGVEVDEKLIAPYREKARETSAVFAAEEAAAEETAEN